MNKDFIKSIATLIVSTLIIFSPKTAWASDTELPVLDESSGVLSSTNLSRSEVLTFSFRVTDDVACCSTAFWAIYTVAGTNVDSGRIFYGGTGYGSPNRISGTEQDGIYSHSLQIPSDIAAGTYYLKVQAQDMATRYTHLVQIGAITITVPSASGGTSAGSSSGTSAGSSAVSSSTSASLVSNYKKVVKRNAILQALGISKGKKETITYKVSKNSKSICSLTSAGIRPKKQGICDVTVTKTNSKKQKTNYSVAISFTK